MRLANQIFHFSLHKSLCDMRKRTGCSNQISVSMMDVTGMNQVVIVSLIGSNVHTYAFVWFPPPIIAFSGSVKSYFSKRTHQA